MQTRCIESVFVQSWYSAWYWNLDSRQISWTFWDHFFEVSELGMLVAKVNSSDGAMCHSRDLRYRCHAPTAEKEWEVAATRTTGGRGTGAGSRHTAISQHLSVPRGSRTSQVRPAVLLQDCWSTRTVEDHMTTVALFGTGWICQWGENTLLKIAMLANKN